MLTSKQRAILRGKANTMDPVYIVSQGMILMAEDASGKLLLLGPDGNTNNGAIVG